MNTISYFLSFFLTLVLSDLNDPSNPNLCQPPPVENKPEESCTKFEVRALMVKCKKPPCECDNTTLPGQIVVPRFDYTSTEDTTSQDHIYRCRKKLLLTVKVHNQGRTNCKNQYIIIDHIFDPETKKSQRLVNPYVLKIRQEPILQTYPIQFDHTLNSGPTEKIINKKTSPDFTGCNTQEPNPTCGAVKYKNEVIPYSTGFCCSCKDGAEQAPPIDTNAIISDVSASLSNDSNECPPENDFNRKNIKFIGSRGVNQYVAPIFNRQGIEATSNSGHAKDIPLRRSLNGKVKRYQTRGGQDCNDNETLPKANPDTSHDSAHCMIFSDLWYSAYTIQAPLIEHTLSVQLYEKLEDPTGSCFWLDLTKGSPMTIGSRNCYTYNEEQSIMIHYSQNKHPDKEHLSIDYDTKKLLVPESLKNVDSSKFPEMMGGVKEYLLVNIDQIHEDGSSCDKPGVGYHAFANQPNKCNSPPGSCLQNQPKDMWQQDHQLDLEGKKGQYFVKFYGEVPEYLNNITCTDNDKKSFSLYYDGSHTSTLEFEIRADENFVLKPNCFASITEVYSDSTSTKKTVITVKVTNAGLVSSVFLVSLCGFPMDVPASFNNIISKPALIAPQHQHIFTLEIECELTVLDFTGNVQVINVNKKIIASRRLRIHRGDRCICIWHCKCACFVADRGLKCFPISLKEYHAAGFQGGLPVSLHMVRYTFLDDLISITLYVFMFLFLTLLIMGLIKAIIGLYVVAIGLWGLDVILGLPKKMHCYYERNLCHRSVIYDEEGWPIHPDTKKRVRNTATATEFCTNVMFFVIYPIAVILFILKKLFVTVYRTECECHEAKKHYTTPVNSHDSVSKSGQHPHAHFKKK